MYILDRSFIDNSTLLLTKVNLYKYDIIIIIIIYEYKFVVNKETSVHFESILNTFVFYRYCYPLWTIVLKYVHKSYLASIPVSTCCKRVFCVCTIMMKINIF